MICPLRPDRVRKICGTFAFIEHRFVQDGFWSDVDCHGLLLYLFLVMVADRYGLSYYSYDKICTLLRLCWISHYMDFNYLIIWINIILFHIILTENEDTIKS